MFKNDKSRIARYNLVCATRVWFNGRTSGCQSDDGSSILPTRTQKYVCDCAPIEFSCSICVTVENFVDMWISDRYERDTPYPLGAIFLYLSRITKPCIYVLFI